MKRGYVTLRIAVHNFPTWLLIPSLPDMAFERANISHTVP